jgi:predicted DNA-binding protein (MmcQ/YjbR family)
MLDNHHHGAAHLAVWLPQSLEGQLTLIEADPARFFRPPYVGPKGWIGVVLDTNPDWAEVTLLVRDSYRHVATAKLCKALEIAEGSRA